MSKIKTVLFALLLVSLVVQFKKEEQIDSKSTTISKIGKREVLLIGTFHYNNPGADIAKTKSFDILKEDAQNELDFIADKIVKFKPAKIFVEWGHDEQAELDSLYQLYTHKKYFTNDGLSEFYKMNEIFQLAFRVAKLGDIPQVNGIDYTETKFPFDSLMAVLERNKQTEIQSKIEEMTVVFTEDFDDKIEKGTSLLDLTYYLNTAEFRKMSNEFHNEIPLLAGSKDNFIGPFLTSEWYRRNLYMWSLVQKSVDATDERIMILSGASHAAIMKNFIDQNDEWKVVELKSIIEE